MARVVRFHKAGGPEVLQIEEEQLPKPKAGEVHFAVTAIGLNRAEAAFRSDNYMESPRLPARPGVEASGRVLAIGEGVTGLSVGDDISIVPGFSQNDYGLYGSEAIVPAANVIKSPPGLDPVKAAAVWSAYLTAWGAIIGVGNAQKGDYVIIPAASSSVGIAAIQICNSIGAIPIAATRGKDKVAALHKLGAEHVIVTKEQDLPAEVARITGGKGARIAFDPVGGPYIETLGKAMGDEGTIFVYGGLSDQETPFPRRFAMGKGLSIAGYTMRQVKARPDRFERAVKFVIDGLKSGALDPVIDKVFTLDQIVEAHRYLESNQQIGKIVVKV